MLEYESHETRFKNYTNLQIKHCQIRVSLFQKKKLWNVLQAPLTGHFTLQNVQEAA